MASGRTRSSRQQADMRTQEQKLRAAVRADAGDNYQMNHVAASMVHAALLPLYQNGNMSDLTVTCGGRTFRVHKAIVCSQSPFFDRACNSGFRESQENKIDLPEDDPDTVDRFFEFLYSGNYSDGEHFQSLPSEVALMPVRRVLDILDADNDEELGGSDDGSDHSGCSWTTAAANEHAEEHAEQEPLEFDSESDHEDIEMSDLRASAQAAIDQEIEQLSSLPISLRVYTLADKYDVPALRLLAKERFMVTASNRWVQSQRFLDIVNQVFETTMEHDPLRAFLCELIEPEYRASDEFALRIKAVMMKHADMGMMMSERLRQSYKAIIPLELPKF